MALADSKKIQTMVNILGQQAQIIRAAVATMRTVEIAYNALNPTPSVTGTSLQGNKAALAAGLNTIDTEISGQEWTDQINGIVLSHRGKAI